jgi:hypothetical protein
MNVQTNIAANLSLTAAHIFIMVTFHTKNLSTMKNLLNDLHYILKKSQLFVVFLLFIKMQSALHEYSIVIHGLFGFCCFKQLNYRT